LVAQLFQSAELKKGNTKYAINQSHTNNLVIAWLLGNTRISETRKVNGIG